MTKREAIASLKERISITEREVSENKYFYTKSKRELCSWKWELLKFRWKKRKEKMDDFSCVTSCVPVEVIDKALEEIDSEAIREYVQDMINKHVKDYFLYKYRGRIKSNDNT